MSFPWSFERLSSASEHPVSQSCMLMPIRCLVPLITAVMQYWGRHGHSSCSALAVQVRLLVTGLNGTAGFTIWNVRRSSMGGNNTAVLSCHPVFCLWKWPEHLSEVLVSHTRLFHCFQQNGGTVNSSWLSTRPWYFFAYLGFLETMHFTIHILSLPDWLLYFLFVFIGT